MANYTPTDEQVKAIELANDNSVQTLKILAYAGAGKTSTLTLVAESMPNKRGIYLAFNKAIVEDVKRKMPVNVEVRTFHSLAYGAMPKYIINKLKNGLKFTEKTYISDLLRKHQVTSLWVTGNKILSDEQILLRKNLGMPTEETVSTQIDTAKQFKILKFAMDRFLMNTDSEPSYDLLLKTIPNSLNIKLEHDYITPIVDMLLPILIGLWNDYKSEQGVFQIPHDVYLKLYALSQPQINKDFILFDEAQDADSLMLHILKAQNTKVILVGDTYQQLYEWRGAINAMQQIQGETCYLTQSFRFGATIADNANKLLNILGNDKPLTGASPIDGYIHSYNTFPKDINAIICRTNVGVVNSALDYASLYPNTKIFIDITGGQGEMLDTLKAIEDLNRLSENKPTTGAYKTHAIIQYFDTFSQLEEYVENFPSDLTIAPIFKLWQNHGANEVERIITNFASEYCKHNHDLRIQTVHKSKGLEWDNVAFCDDFEGYYVKSEGSEQINPYHPFKSDQAIRAVYVAQTRAKRKIYNFGDLGERLKIKAPNFDLVPEIIIPKVEINECKKVQKSKRKYTPRDPEKEKIRNAKALEGIRRATLAGTIGRPKAVDDTQLSDIKSLILARDFTLQKISEMTNLSLSTIKRIKKSIH